MEVLVKSKVCHVCIKSESDVANAWNNRNRRTTGISLTYMNRPIHLVMNTTDKIVFSNIVKLISEMVEVPI